MQQTNPYAPPKAALEDEPPPQIELASRAARLGAALIDSIMVGGAAFLGASGGFFWAMVGMVAATAVNFAMLHHYRATVGKRAMKLRIILADGREAELWRIIVLRELPRIVIGFIPIANLLSIVDVLFIFGAERRCVHDYMASTVVVDV